MILAIKTSKSRYSVRFGDHRLDPYYTREAASLLRLVPFWADDEYALLKHIASGGHVTPREVRHFWACKGQFANLMRGGAA